MNESYNTFEKLFEKIVKEKPGWVNLIKKGKPTPLRWGDKSRIVACRLHHFLFNEWLEDKYPLADQNIGDAFSQVARGTRDYPQYYTLDIFKQYLKDEARQKKETLLQHTKELKYNQSEIGVLSVSSKQVVSYNWLGKKQEIEQLYQAMRGLWIESNTSLKDFTAGFSKQPVQNFTPVKWHDDNASEVLYFIRALEEAELIEKGTRTNYQKLTACIVKVDGMPFKASFKELKQRLNYNLSIEKQHAIDKLVKGFL